LTVGLTVGLEASLVEFFTATLTGDLALGFVGAFFAVCAAGFDGLLALTTARGVFFAAGLMLGLSLGLALGLVFDLVGVAFRGTVFPCRQTVSPGLGVTRPPRFFPIAVRKQPETRQA